MGIFQPQFKMGLGDMFDTFLGETTGLGGKGSPDPHNLDDAAYEDYYNKAINGINGSGSGTAEMRDSLQRGVQGQLAGLDNNMAGRKKAFGEDMSRSFGNDIQQKGRAAGGTGNLAQTLSPQGGMYDSEARQTARGYNDLYSQGTKDLSTLSGVQNNLNNQDFQRANAGANVNMNRINQRLGIAENNAANSRNSDAIGSQRRIGTYSAAANMLGGSGMGGGGGGGGMPFAKGGSVPKMAGGGIMGMLDPMGLMGGGGGGGGGGSSMMSMLPMLAMALAKGGSVEGKVPGRASVRGDSLKNDTVDAKLSPEEIVLPRSVTMSKDPVRKSAQFVDETVNQGKHRHKSPAYFVGGADMDSLGGANNAGTPEEDTGTPEGTIPGTDGKKTDGSDDKKQSSPMDAVNGIFKNALSALQNEKWVNYQPSPGGKATGMAKGGALKKKAYATGGRY